MGWEETLLQKNCASAALLQKTGFSRVACFKAGFFFKRAFIRTAVYSLFTIPALSQNGKEGINLSASTTGRRFSIFNLGETRIVILAPRMIRSAIYRYIITVESGLEGFLFSSVVGFISLYFKTVISFSPLFFCIYFIRLLSVDELTLFKLIRPVSSR